MNCWWGEAIQPFRNQIVLATKLHLNRSQGDTEMVIRRHLEESMERLRTVAVYAGSDPPCSCRYPDYSNPKRVFHDGADV